MFLAVLKMGSRITGPIPKRDLTLYHPLQRAKEGVYEREIALLTPVTMALIQSQEQRLDLIAP